MQQKIVTKNLPLTFISYFTNSILETASSVLQYLNSLKSYT